jgi:acyl-CoA synthetase (AMP-forming)/AMP-acid ligase II
MQTFTVARNLVDLVRERAQRTPDRGYSFLPDGLTTRDELSYAKLDESCQRLAAAFQDLGLSPGSRALLLYRPGLEFVRAFWACFYAGLVAVPAPPPVAARLRRTVPRLRAIALDCSPDVVLTDDSTAEAQRLGEWVPELPSLVLDTTRLADPNRRLRIREPREHSVAVIQYTSGSTGTPRGVAVSHCNFLHNLELLRDFHGRQDHMVMVHWLPLYHDMGLIRGMMSPLHMGGDCAMMPPMQFIQRPLRWLTAASRLRATTIGAPNFGYELCNRKISETEVRSLDLSAVLVAFCSAEPIRARTVSCFLSKFSHCGFSSKAFRPAYGLAEATVAVCGETRGAGPRIHLCDGRALRAHAIVEVKHDDGNAVALTSCGGALGDQEVITVDAEGRRARPGAVGEIWIRGRSVAQGYWNDPAGTRATFGARLADGTGPYLKTGDLGWLSPAGGLIVTGRKKDLIIVRGQNYYPQDIEFAVESGAHGVRAGCSAAFAIDDRLGEALAIVCEPATERPSPEECERLVARIRKTVSEEFDLAVHTVGVVEQSTIPKTASGKVRRNDTREHLRTRALCLLHLWTLGRNRRPARQRPSRDGMLGAEESNAADRDDLAVAADNRRLPHLRGPTPRQWHGGSS